MDSRLGLPVNTVLDGSYRIERVVGSGGFGITYEAEDMNLGTLVAIKEYYPFDFGDRDSTMSVRPKSDRHRKTFDWGRSNFLEEARTLARFEHPSIVRVTRVFEANSTAYMVMRFEQGHSFEDWLSRLDRLPTQEELDSIVTPMLDALQMMHASDFLHRDIAPDNIIVRSDGTPVLLDFGAARRAVAEMSRTMTGIVKAGYSPHEQYSSDSRLQGPWSDLYALGGTLYRAVTGHPPEEATLRVDEDRMPPAAQVSRKDGYRPGFLSAIDACLKVRHSERPRSVTQLRPMMLGRKSQPRPSFDRFVGAFRTPSKAPQKAPTKPPTMLPVSSRTKRSGLPPPAARRWPAIAAAAMAVLGGAYGGYEFSRWQPAEPASITMARRTEEHVRDDAKRLADAAAAKKIEDDNARLEADERSAEAKRLADAADKKKADDERVAAEAKRVADADAAKRVADDERAQRDADARREEERVAREADATTRQAKTERPKLADPERVASVTLSAEERATFVKRIQEALRQSKCYDGGINGSSDEAQKSLDRYVKSARKKGSEKPARIELAKATASDFDEWLQQADTLKGSICVPATSPKLTPPTRERTVDPPRTKERNVERTPVRERSVERTPVRERNTERASSRPQPSYTPRPSESSGGGGGGGQRILGLQ